MGHQITELARTLSICFLERKISEGISLIKDNQSLIEHLDSTDHGSAQLAGVLALWFDQGLPESIPNRQAKTMVGMLERQHPTQSVNRPFIDCIYLELLSGIVELHRNWSQSKSHFYWILTAENYLIETEHSHLLALSSFYLSKYYRKQNHFAEASDAIENAIRHSSNRFPKFVAVLNTTKAWIFFKQGYIGSACELLEQSKGILDGGDDYFSVANIYSALARVELRRQDYIKADKLFDSAIARYQTNDPTHRNLARILANSAVANVHLGIGPNLSIEDHQIVKPINQRRQLVDASRIAKATKFLDRAQCIANSMDLNARALGIVRIHKAYAYLQLGELLKAREEAEGAREVARSQDDHLILARSYGILSSIAIEMMELQGHSRLMDDMRSASSGCLDYAKKTGNKRLLGYAHAVVARAELIGTSLNIPSARSHVEQARRCLAAEAGDKKRDWLASQLDALERFINSHSGPNPISAKLGSGYVPSGRLDDILRAIEGEIVKTVYEREQSIAATAESLDVGRVRVRKWVKDLKLAPLRKPGRPPKKDT